MRQLQAALRNLRTNLQVFCLICPVDPLIHTDNGLSQIMYLSEKRLPFVYIAGISFGCVGPVTAAGVIVIGLADTLVGLLISQLTRKGAPFIASKFSDNLNMKTGTVSHSRPELLIANGASADVFRYLGLPFCLNHGGTDASAFNQQNVFDIAMGYYNASLSGTNLNYGLGSLESGNSCCLENLIFGDEVVGFVSPLIGGIEVSTYTLAEDLIHKVGPGGNFLVEEHTFKHVRDFWEPSVFASQTYDQWRASNKKDMNVRLNERVKKIIAKGPKYSLSNKIVSKLDDCGKGRKMRRQKIIKNIVDLIIEALVRTSIGLRLFNFLVGERRFYLFLSR
ncbi:MAG: trimethylamine methyltransferase family protein [Dehalobacterium sp.]